MGERSKLSVKECGFQTRTTSVLRKAVAVLICFWTVWILCACSSPQNSEQESPGDPMGKVEKVDGDVLVLRPGARETVHLHPGDPLFGGDVVSTEGGGAVELRLSENSVLSLASGSSLRINRSLANGLGAPSVFLQRGRLILVTRQAGQQSGFRLETFHVGVLCKAAELEVGVAEDLGLLLCVRKGEARVEGAVGRISLAERQETEVDFLERVHEARQLKDRNEADWAAWMAARFRNLPTKMPEIVAKMDRFLKETATQRLEVRTELDRRALEIEALVRSLGEDADQAEAAGQKDSMKKLRGLARLQAESLVHLRHLGTRTELLLLEADRLRRRSQALKKELGERHFPLEEYLRLLIEGGKPLAKALSEERSYLAAQSQQWKAAVQAAGGLPPEQEEKPLPEAPAKASRDEKGESAQGKAKAGSVSNTKGSKASAAKSSVSPKPTEKAKTGPGQEASKAQQKRSSGGKTSSGGSSSKNKQSSSTKKENPNRPKNSGP